MEYCPATRKKEILPFVITEMDLEGVMLRELSQTETSTARYHLYVESKGRKSQTQKSRVENWLPGPEGWWNRGWWKVTDFQI